MDELFEAVRGSCSPRTWSRGVELARGGAVSARGEPDEDDGDEIFLAVQVPGRMVSPTVTLVVDDEDWTCDCQGRVDPCEHVAAAVIALRRARRSGRQLPRDRPAPAAPEAPDPRASVTGGAGLPHPAYRFTRAGDKLRFERVLVDPRTGEERCLRAPLTSLCGGRGDQRPRALASTEDMAVDRVLGARPPGWISGQRMLALLGALPGCRDVTLDGAPVEVDGEAAELRAYVEDDAADGGFLLRVGHVEAIDEVFENGAVRVGDTLRPVGEVPLSRDELALLARGRRFAPTEAAELATRVIPALEARLPLEIRSRRLPRASRSRPRLGLHAEAGGGSGEGERLTLWPVVVYGDPPVAEVRGGELSLLDHSAPLPMRDEVAERRLRAQSDEQLGLRADRPSHFVGFEAFRLAARLAAGPAAFAGPVIGEGLSAFAADGGDLSPELAIDDGEGFELRFAQAGSASAGADLARVITAWQRGEDHVPLLDGGWAPLPEQWLERHGHHLAALLAARDERDEQGRLPPAARLDLLRLADALEQPPPPALEGLRPLLDTSRGAVDDDRVDIPQVELPADLDPALPLRDYQRQGVDWLCFLRRAGLGALLADDMGLGKTLQALCAIRGRTLVVAPTSVLRNWGAEIERFRPGLTHATYHGPDRALDPAAAVTLTTYAILRRDIERLAAQRWETVVLDEAQTIKNPDSQVARAAYELRAPFLIALTGTPVENRLEDLWSLFHWLDRGLLGGRSDFADRYARPIADGDAAAAARLRRRIRPFVLRRLKRQVAAELPPRTEVVLRCELSATERALYDAVRAGTREEMLRALAQGGSVIAALEALLRLRQAACHPALVPGADGRAGSAKLSLLRETIESLVAADHRALVFSQWTSLLDLVAPMLASVGIDWLRLDGSTPTAERQRIVERFNHPDGPPVMLLSLKAGGVGLNLPAADHVFLLDPWWNPTVEDQAAGRAHRIGQQRPVVVHHLVAEDTVDERILELQQRKRALAEAAMERADEAALSAALSRDELLSLLS